MSLNNKDLVLLVDDDTVTLNLILDSFKQKWGNKYQYEKASDPVEAEEILREAAEAGQKPALIVSDYHMPEKMGDQFLIETGKLMPNVPLFLHSGLADATTVSFIHAHCPQVQNIPKPWNSDAYLSVIDSALQS